MKIPEIILNVSYKRAKQSELTTIGTTKKAAEVFRLLHNDGTILFQEEFILLCLNSASNVIGFSRVSKGGLTGTVADIRIIATIALNTLGTTQVLLSHNHPSGRTTPSEADKQFTMQITQALLLFNIKVVDHIIITDESYYSMLDEGNL